MSQKLTKQQKGFTIIEVLIVLAIAGLIMLIVFLAVPALQRNSRNTSRTNDVGRALGAAQEVINNNNGQLTQLTTTNLRDAIGDTLAYYEVDSIVVVDGANSPASNEDSMVIHKTAQCGEGNSVEAGSSRQLVASFRVESGVGGSSKGGASGIARCTQS